ncbi:monocarboxylate transporter 10 [Sinocyclocheilus rhinocerous]|uniref:monocarboxylate transporter 10 n=1 Tax=Sinocyclocheilus rhinocerous TaxID=307959 RepID=UPI0007BA12B5|nr:PREDICTED: monocarboxylate transporter 10 [Sinocyclocheilus rhinocerous]
MTETASDPAPGAAEEPEAKRENGDCAADAPRQLDPPEGGWGWVVMLASMWCNGSVFGIQNAFGILFVSLLQEFGSETDEDLRFKTAWVGSLSMGMIFFCSPIVSVFTDLFGCRITAVAGAAVAFVGLLASSFVTSLGPLYFTYGIVFACGCSFAYQPSLVILGHYFKRRLGLVNGIVTAGSSVFTITLPYMLSGLLKRVGFAYTLRVLSVFMFMLMLAGFTYKPLLPKPVSSSKSGSRCPSLRRVFNVHIWRSLGYRIWAFGIPAALYGYFVPYVHLMKHVEERFGADANKEVLLTCIGITSGVGRLIFGRAAECVPGVNQLIYNIVIISDSMCNGLKSGVAEPVVCLVLCAGFLRDRLGSYDVAFYLAGIPPIIGGAVLCLIPWVEARRRSKEAQPATEATEKMLESKSGAQVEVKPEEPESVI